MYVFVKNLLLLLIFYLFIYLYFCVGAAILFFLHFAAFIAVSVLALRNYAAIQRSGSSDSVQKVTLNWSTIWLLLVCVGVGFVLSIIYLTFAQRYFFFYFIFILFFFAKKNV